MNSLSKSREKVVLEKYPQNFEKKYWGGGNRGPKKGKSDIWPPRYPLPIIFFQKSEDTFLKQLFLHFLISYSFSYKNSYLGVK